MLTSTSLLTLLLALTLLLIPTLTLRLLYILPPWRPRPPPGSRNPNSPSRLLIVLGSGGHTAEMTAMLRDLDPGKYRHRTWVVSKGDSMSVERAREFERGLAKRERGAEAGTWEIVVVPRAREIHQSLLTTPLSALRCLWACFEVLRQPFARRYRVDGFPLEKGQETVMPKEVQRFPDLILTNGPATGAIVVLASLILRFFNVQGCNSQGSMRTIYVESWARVKRPSLSGRLLVWVVDRFLVQWESLQGYGQGRAEYRGVLV